MSYNLNAIYKAFEERYGNSRVQYHHARPNTKLVGIICFNVAPILTCADCTHETCGNGGCYATKNMLCHGYDLEKNNCLRAWIDNTIMVISEREKYFENVRKDIAKFEKRNIKRQKETFVRVHASGDFYSLDVMNKWFEIAREFPNVRFLAYTKRYDFAMANANNIPSNFCLIISAWNGIKLPNELTERFPIAFINDDDRKSRFNRFVCGGSCENCKVCWFARAYGLNIEFNKH